MERRQRVARTPGDTDRFRLLTEATARRCRTAEATTTPNPVHDAPGPAQ